MTAATAPAPVLAPVLALAPEPTGPDEWSAETVCDDSRLSTLRAEWNDLFQRCSTATPFQSHAWLESWWQSYGVAGQLRVVLVRTGGRLVAAAALMRQRRSFCTVLTPIGGALSDFTDVLIDDAVVEPAARVMAAALLQQRDWQLIDFPETRQGAMVGRVLLAAWPGRRWQAPASLCLELPATPTEDLVRELPSHTRKTVRRRINQIARLGIDVRAVTAEETDRAITDLLRLHALQWEGRGVNPEHLRPQFARHLADATRGMIAAGQAALLEYRVSDRLMASNLIVVGSDLAGGYLYGADAGLRDQVDVATLLLTTTLPLACERGCSTMSMLRGAEPYKMRWRPQEATNERVLLARAGSLRALVYATGVLARRRAVHAAKERMPWLRNVRDTARRLAARLKSRRP
jgi:CelD/BcsL family acetyltransferase involved in cellulose biosynthesis